MKEQKSSVSQLNPILQSIRGKIIQKNINTLATFSRGEAIGEGVNRLALTPEDLMARTYIRRLMASADMEIIQHPLGIVGIYPGINQELDYVGVGSHFDSVPNGGKYDGCVGVLSAITAVKAFNDHNIRPQRSIAVFAFTGEESSRFHTALFGSRGMFRGLAETVLDMKRPGDISLRQALSELGFCPSRLAQPLVKPDDLLCFLELHVEQGPLLANENLQIGIVEAIAAPERRIITVGNSLDPINNNSLGPEIKRIRITSLGKGGHSGATPMGKNHRADALLPIATLLMALPEAVVYQTDRDDVNLFIECIDIQDSSINKIPKTANLGIIVTGNRDAIIEAEVAIYRYIDRINQYYSRTWTLFCDPLRIQSDVEDSLPTKPLFEPKRLHPQLQKAGAVIHAVNQICRRQRYVDDNIVGTIGTVRLTETGTIELGLDIRGLDGKLRDATVADIISRSQWFGQDHRFGPVLEGSMLPARMNRHIVELLEEETNSLGLRARRMNSYAGHDALNSAFVGVPTGLFFIPSENGGASHNPDEFTRDEHLQNGARLLAATLYKLANTNYNLFECHT